MHIMDELRFVPTKSLRSKLRIQKSNKAHICIVVLEDSARHCKGSGESLPCTINVQRVKA